MSSLGFPLHSPLLATGYPTASLKENPWMRDLLLRTGHSLLCDSHGEKYFKYPVLFKMKLTKWF